MQHTGDLLVDLVDRLVELLPAAGAVVGQLEAEARRVYGGEKVYITKRRMERDQKAEALARVDPERGIREQARELGLSRKMIYRHIRFRKEWGGPR